jgi:hypothetical protein
MSDRGFEDRRLGEGEGEGRGIAFRPTYKKNPSAVVLFQRNLSLAN